MLLVQGRREIGILPADTPVQSHKNAMDTWTDCKMLKRVLRENVGSACSYCRTVTSESYGYMD